MPTSGSRLPGSASSLGRQRWPRMSGACTASSGTSGLYVCYLSALQMSAVPCVCSLSASVYGILLLVQGSGVLITLIAFGTDWPMPTRNLPLFTSTRDPAPQWEANLNRANFAAEGKDWRADAKLFDDYLFAGSEIARPAPRSLPYPSPSIGLCISSRTALHQLSPHRSAKNPRSSTSAIFQQYPVAAVRCAGPTRLGHDRYGPCAPL